MKIFKKSQVLLSNPIKVYNVISDVDKYCKFIPFCNQSKVMNHSIAYSMDNILNRKVIMEAELGISFYKFKESYISQVTCVPFEMVKAESSSKLFKKLNTTWHIKGKYDDKETLVEYCLEYEFNMLIYEKLSRLVFDSMSNKMMDAFVQEIYRKEKEIPKQLRSVDE